MLRPHPRPTRTDPPFPYPTLFRSHERSLARGSRANTDESGEAGDRALGYRIAAATRCLQRNPDGHPQQARIGAGLDFAERLPLAAAVLQLLGFAADGRRGLLQLQFADAVRSEEHTSALQSLMRISYAVFCLNNKKKQPI